MLKKVVVTAALGAAIVGGGTAALASSGSHDVAAPSTAATPTAATPTVSSSGHPNAAKNKRAGKHRQNVRLGRALHGTWVTKDAKTGAVVTHDAIRGVVSSVSPTSITVKAADGVSETYQVTSTTKVRKRAASTTSQPTPSQTPGQKTRAKQAKRAKVGVSSIGAIKVGDQAVVVGTGTTTLTATHIVDGLQK